MRSIFFSALLLVTACSKAPATDDPYEARDPIRPVNEKIFAFNVAADKYVIGPVAHGYHHLPDPVRTGFANFLTNLHEPVNALDGLLAAKPDVFFTSSWRFVLNSTFGLLGFRDFAGENAGLTHLNWDFGRTLGRYGLNEGPYIVLPIAGPSTLRDGTGRVVDGYANPVDWYLGSDYTLGQSVAVIVTKRDENDAIVRDVYYESLDPYIAARSVFYQHKAFDDNRDYARPDSAVPGK